MTSLPGNVLIENMMEKQFVLRFACVVITALVSWQCSESGNGEDIDADAGEPDFIAPDTTDSADMPLEDADMEIPDAPPPDTTDVPEEPEEEEIEEPDPTGLGPGMSMGEGKDPDVAVDSLGHLHVVYSRDHSTYYRKVVYPSDPGTEILVGGGSDPQVVVDSLDRPHVVMGAVSYSRWTGSGFAAPMNIFSGWRKPRIAVDGLDRVYITISRQVPETERVLLFVVEDGTVIVDSQVVGHDNNGAVDCDSNNTAHITWRDGRVGYTSYSIEAGIGISQMLHPSSDFSWCAVDLRDNSVYVVNTVRGGGGIHYRFLVGEDWSAEAVIAEAEVTGVDDPDNVGPTIDVDQRGYKYVTFAGRDRIPYYFVVGPDDAASAVLRLDPEGGSLSGGKYENPNVGSRPDMTGAFAAWGSGTVYVRGIGVM